MIKKPEVPTLADFLRADQNKIDQKYKALDDYKQKVFNQLVKDFKTGDAFELAIRLAEKYHEPFKINEKQGRKKKWTPKIEAMLAVFIQLRLEEDRPRSIDDDIMEILTWEPWKQFAEKGNKQEVLSLESFRKRYDTGKRSELFEIEMDAYKKDPDAWMARLIKNLTS